MSRRSDNPVPQFAKDAPTATFPQETPKPVLPPSNSVQQETDHARQTPLPHAHETQQAYAEAPFEKEITIVEADPPISKRDIRRKVPFAAKDELRYWLDIYLANKGTCPICHMPHHGRGISGHISKCLPTLKSKTALTSTT